MAVPHLTEQVGRVLAGRYRLVAMIGTGVSAAVYLADDTKMRRRVAIKVLHAALAHDEAFIKRFKAEAHTAADLSHPHIMRVWDWGEDKGEPFLVLEYLGGGSLRQVLDLQGRLSLSQVAKLGLHTARALDYAHRNGLVHRDVKPANLLFDEEGRIAIADFGLARALASAALTEPGSMLGTARYAAPEQVRGKQLRGSADVYALALVMIEAISGEVPFASDTTIATLMARLEHPVDIPESCGPLSAILSAATQTDPDARVSAGELAIALDAVLREVPEPEAIAMPGALIIDTSQTLSGVDSTMMPGAFDQTPAFYGEQHNDHVISPTVINEIPQTTQPAKVIPWRRRLPSIKQVMITIVLAILIAATTFVGLFAYYKTGRELVVPQLTGLPLDGAKLRANEADIKVRVSEEFREDVPAGTTSSQSPSPNAKVHAREVVTLRVSKGPAPREVPSIIGTLRNEAAETLRSKGFVVDNADVIEVASETEPNNKVLEQDPLLGLHPKGTHVKLTVSSGPKPRIVPMVQGMSQDEAVKVLEAQQLQVKVTQGFSDAVPVGKASATTPSVGSSVARDSAITLIISKGPELVAVPDVSGMDVAAATDRLGQVGLKVTAVYGPPDGKTVFSTSPTVGTKVKKGSEIAIYKR